MKGMKNFLKHLIKCGLRNLGLEVRIARNRDEIIQDRPAQDSVLEAQLTLLVYVLSKIVLLPEKSSLKLLGLLRSEDCNLSNSSNISAGSLNDWDAEIKEYVRRGNSNFVLGGFEKAQENYRRALSAWTKTLEKGSRQDSQVILIDVLRDLLAQSKCDINDILSVTISLCIYLETGSLTEFGHRSKIALHCQSNAYFNDFLSHLISICTPPCSKLIQGKSVFGEFNSSDLDVIDSYLSEDGYYIFPRQLPTNICDHLIDFALTTPGQGYIGSEVLPGQVVYNLAKPQVEGCYISEQDCLDNSDIQTLVVDPYLLAIAQKHLGTQPILATVAMWWSSCVGSQPNSSMAQLYHFDMDWIKWTNFFIYLTDVTSDTGPHCYVRKTHQRGSKPRELLERGYARIVDEDLHQFYPAGNFVEITGHRGTSFVGDTRCYHKAKPLKNGERLILEITYANTLWLGGIRKNLALRPNYNPRLLQLAQSHPRIFSQFVPVES